MQYALLIYTNEAAAAVASEQQGREMHAEYMAYSEAMQKAGIMSGGERLRPTSAATTVRVAKGKTEVLNGPYAETKEQLGGFYLIDAPDLDTALSWAARCPGATYGTVEVRPIWTM
ncbi:MAG TPA: YciI family protein [Burkholderiales bacterium]